MEEGGRKRGKWGQTLEAGKVKEKEHSFADILIFAQ